MPKRAVGVEDAAQALKKAAGQHGWGGGRNPAVGRTLSVEGSPNFRSCHTTHITHNPT